MWWDDRGFTCAWWEFLLKCDGVFRGDKSGVAKGGIAVRLEAAKTKLDVNVDGEVKTSDCEDDEVARDPAQGKSVPKRSDWEVAVGTGSDVGIHGINEGERGHKDWEHNPESVGEVAISV